MFACMHTGSTDEVQNTHQYMIPVLVVIFIISGGSLMTIFYCCCCKRQLESDGDSVETDSAVKTKGKRKETAHQRKKK